MEEETHLSDFHERLEQLTDMEAVKDAYMAYVSSRFDSFRVFKTPRALAYQGTQFGSYLEDTSGLISRWEECVHDELLFIVGQRGTLEDELTQWMEKPRAAVLSRLERLLLERPGETGQMLDGQASFHRSLRTLTGDRDSQFSALLIELGNTSGFGPVLKSCLPPGSGVFAFTNSCLAALILNCDQSRLQWLVHKTNMTLTKILLELDATERPAIGVASWPFHPPSLPRFVQSLQQALQDAVRINQLPSPRDTAIVFANTLVSSKGQGPDKEGGAGSPVRGARPGPTLQGGAAESLGESD